MTLLEHIAQRKGEAEMTLLDWLISAQDDIKEGKAVFSVVMSGDVDAVYNHMFVVSKYWPRNSNRSFKNKELVILQKPRSMVDIYNVTKMLEVFEQSFADRDIGMKLSVSVSMAGNDFIPSCHEKSHGTILKHFVRDKYRKNLYIFKDKKIKISQSSFIDFYKTLYCPKRYNPSNYTSNDVQALTIAKKKMKCNNADSKRTIQENGFLQKQL